MVFKPYARLQHIHNEWRSLLWACFRLGRFHTLMGYVIFTAPAILTVILYHGAHPSAHTLQRAWSLVWRLFVCVVSYRGAGLAWDDIIDHEVDAKVSRTMSRPIPSGAISVNGGVAFCIFQSIVTMALFTSMLPAEAGYVCLIGTIVFLVYPYLKFYTHWAQLGGAILMACIVPMAWAACAASSSHLVDSDPAAIVRSSLRILRKDSTLCMMSFIVEVLFSFIHETVYGCQDTPEDLALGVFSTSILFGYEGTKRVLMPLTFVYLGALAYAFRAAGLHWIALSILPACVLISEAYKVKMDNPKSCGIYARRGIYTKMAVCATAALDLAYIQMTTQA